MEDLRYMERACQYLDLKHSEIEQICRQYFQDKGMLQSCEVLAGGAVNTTFKICWDGKWYVLRFYIRDKNVASIEEKVYRLVQKTVPISEMLFASSEPYPFAIFSFCSKPHIYDASKSISKRLSYDLGSALAAIHSYHFAQAGLFGANLSVDTEFAEGSSPYLEYCLEHLTQDSLAWKRLGQTLSKEMVSFMEDNRHYFPVIERGGCLVHSDFKPVNLLWNELQGLTVLDWEFAHSGDGIMDFGILLRHFKDFSLDISRLENGYQENGGKLSSNWIQRARITDFINIIQLLNTPLERPKLFQSLVDSLNFTLGNWKDLRTALEEA
jgi:aminoglycoside phosphotransferase (APT) family kinase protein